MTDGSSTIDDIILDPIENVFDSMGMMQGDLAPVKRAAVGAAIGYALAYGLQPKFAFMPDPNGSKKKVPKLFTPSATKEQIAAKQTTYFPAWAIVAAPAIIFSVLI